MKTRLLKDRWAPTMQIGNHEAERLAREGLEALRQGRAGEARGRLEAAARAERENARIWLLLAVACRAHKDQAAEEARARPAARNRAASPCAA